MNYIFKTKKTLSRIIKGQCPDWVGKCLGGVRDSVPIGLESAWGVWGV